MAVTVPVCSMYIACSFACLQCVPAYLCNNLFCPDFMFVLNLCVLRMPSKRQKSVAPQLVFNCQSPVGVSVGKRVCHLVAMK